MNPIAGKYKVIIIAALSENHVIGINNRLPWNIPEDLARFKKITTGHTVIMGRKTYESIGRPLPNRHNIVLSSKLQTNKVKVCAGLREAFNAVPLHEKEVYIIGGEQVYQEGLLHADEMLLTLVDGVYKGDAHFPDFDDDDWAVIAAEIHPEYQFLSLKRIKNESSTEQ